MQPAIPQPFTVDKETFAGYRESLAYAKIASRMYDRVFVVKHNGEPCATVQQGRLLKATITAK